MIRLGPDLTGVGMKPPLGEDEQHARSTDRKRRGPRPALEPRDDAARQDGRNVHPLPDRRLDRIGRAQHWMIRAKDRTLANAANAVGTRRVRRPSPHTRESVAYRASIRRAAWSRQSTKDRPAFPARRLDRVSEQPSCRATDGRTSAPGLPDETDPSSRQLRPSGHQTSGLTMSSRAPVVSASLS